ncbi:ArsR/SmtB family transcription factor [Pontivivens insulae]|uniref:Biofilm growth-associated repressor n=1 Tax=Pontivivens insulae TaxID=1639689 RepID=A0A2R8A8F8_9RHOB|nr:metalloregulator ArsR/SmtB family transcription factor [Pontivivens insulae]RED18613.1 ArsR family transcriptional regulator [Pontivivens insulae]SPF28511.1 Biofilm growth-associated repressor [Pontivivens insulae]
MAERIQKVVTVAHALAHPVRAQMVERLGEGPASVGDLAAPHALALPTIVRHLDVLADAGLVDTQKAGRVRTCTLNRAALGIVTDWLDHQRLIWEARTDRLEAFLQEDKGNE